MDPFCNVCFMFVMLSCLFLAALWSPAGKGKSQYLGSLVCDVCSCVCAFSMWCLGSGVVLDCIDS